MVTKLINKILYLDYEDAVELADTGEPDSPATADVTTKARLTLNPLRRNQGKREITFANERCRNRKL